MAHNDDSTEIGWKIYRRQKNEPRSPAIAVKATRTALSGIAVQHAGDGYSRRGNVGGSVVHSMF